MPRSVWTYSQINILMHFKTELDLDGGVDATHRSTFLRILILNWI